MLNRICEPGATASGGSVLPTSTGPLAPTTPSASAPAPAAPAPNAVHFGPVDPTTTARADLARYAPRALRRLVRREQWRQRRTAPDLLRRVRDRRGFQSFEIVGTSMAPRFADGDWVGAYEHEAPRYAVLLPGVYVVLLPTGEGEEYDAYVARLDERVCHTAARHNWRGRWLFTFDNAPNRWLWVDRRTPGLRLYQVSFYELRTIH